MNLSWNHYKIYTTYSARMLGVKTCMNECRVVSE